jgi:hypothetical protein
MPRKLSYVTIPLHISAFIYILLALGFAGLLLFCPYDKMGEDKLVVQISGFLTIVIGFAMAVFAEIVVGGLKNGKYWAWIAGICLAGLYIPSGFFLLGIFMLLGLIDEETKAYCKKRPLQDSGSTGLYD